MDLNEIRWGNMEGREISRPRRPGRIGFFLMKRKESCVRRGRGRGEEEEGERMGGVGYFSKVL